MLLSAALTVVLVAQKAGHLLPRQITHREWYGPFSVTFSVTVFDVWRMGVMLVGGWVLLWFGLRRLHRRQGRPIQTAGLILILIAALQLFAYTPSSGTMWSGSGSFWLQGHVRMQLYLDPLFRGAVIAAITSTIASLIVYAFCARCVTWSAAWKCIGCGYDLRGNIHATHCSECGVDCRTTIRRHLALDRDAWNAVYGEGGSAGYREPVAAASDDDGTIEVSRQNAPDGGERAP
jgi:hypothetical protein